MIIKWSDNAFRDLERVIDFLAAYSQDIADKVHVELLEAPDILSEHPRRGMQLPDYLPDEVRRLIVHDYELRYMITDDVIYILHLWHGKENR